MDDPLAAFDQMLRGIVDWVRLMRAYYEACLEMGFSRDEAMTLTIAYQHGLQAASQGQAE